MHNNKLLSSFPELVAAIVLMLFLYTALDKMHSLDYFRLRLSAAPYTKPFAQQLSILIPAAELAAVILLFIPKYRQYGLVFSFILMFAFTTYLGISLLSDIKLPCACGGVLSTISWSNHLVLNGVILLMLFAAIYIQYSNFYCNKQE